MYCEAISHTWLELPKVPENTNNATEDHNDDNDDAQGSQSADTQAEVQCKSRFNSIYIK